jgi:hypothetical protein
MSVKYTGRLSQANGIFSPKKIEKASGWHEVFPPRSGRPGSSAIGESRVEKK